MCLDDGGDDGQAEPGPAGLGCPVGAEPLEWLEQPLDLCGGYRGSGVSHTAGMRARPRFPVTIWTWPPGTL